MTSAVDFFTRAFPHPQQEGTRGSIGPDEEGFRFDDYVKRSRDARPEERDYSKQENRLERLERLDDKRYGDRRLKDAANESAEQQPYNDEGDDAAAEGRQADKPKVENEKPVAEGGDETLPSVQTGLVQASTPFTLQVALDEPLPVVSAGTAETEISASDQPAPAIQGTPVPPSLGEQVIDEIVVTTQKPGPEAVQTPLTTAGPAGPAQDAEAETLLSQQSPANAQSSAPFSSTAGRTLGELIAEANGKSKPAAGPTESLPKSTAPEGVAVQTSDKLNGAVLPAEAKAVEPTTLSTDSAKAPAAGTLTGAPVNEAVAQQNAQAQLRATAEGQRERSVPVLRNGLTETALDARTDPLTAEQEVERPVLDRAPKTADAQRPAQPAPTNGANTSPLAASVPTPQPDTSELPKPLATLSGDRPIAPVSSALQATQPLSIEEPASAIAKIDGTSSPQSRAADVSVQARVHVSNPATLQSDLAIAMSRSLRDGITKFEIQMDPPELGRIEVQLELSKDGRVQAILSADNQDTLDLLQRDHKHLFKALQDSGLDLDSDSLNFSLNDGSERGQREGHDADDLSHTDDELTETLTLLGQAEAAVPTIESYGFRLRAAGGVNLRV